MLQDKMMNTAVQPFRQRFLSYLIQHLNPHPGDDTHIAEVNFSDRHKYSNFYNFVKIVPYFPGKNKIEMT